MVFAGACGLPPGPASTRKDRISTGMPTGIHFHIGSVLQTSIYPRTTRINLIVFYGEKKSLQSRKALPLHTEGI